MSCPNFKKLFTKAADKGTDLEMEMRFLNKHGEYIWHINRASPVKNEEGQITMWLGVTSDIHHQKQHEEELENAVSKRTSELKDSNRELKFQIKEREKRSEELIVANKELIFQIEEKEKRVVELDTANKELEAFSYISSHDLQEPLRKIHTFADRIFISDHASLSDKGKEYFHKIQDAAARMKILIEDLLKYSQVTIGEHQSENTDLT